jgi:hypothetical protein
MRSHAGGLRLLSSITVKPSCHASLSTGRAARARRLLQVALEAGDHLASAASALLGELDALAEELDPRRLVPVVRDLRPWRWRSSCGRARS